MFRCEEKSTPGGDAALTMTYRTVRASEGGRWCLCRPAEDSGTQAGQRAPRALVPRSQDHRSGFTGENLRISHERTQDGQGGFGPQETQGRTEKYSVSRAAHGHPVECAQDGQGGLSPQETQGCTSYKRSTSTTIGGPKECTQDGQGCHGPQETQGCTKPFCDMIKSHVVQLNDLQLRRDSPDLQEAQCAIATDA